MAEDSSAHVRAGEFILTDTLISEIFCPPPSSISKQPGCRQHPTAISRFGPKKGDILSDVEEDTIILQTRNGCAVVFFLPPEALEKRSGRLIYLAIEEEAELGCASTKTIEAANKDSPFR